MTDNLTEEQRRKVMSRNKPSGGKSTEWALRSRLIAGGISGWKIQPADITGKPDFVFLSERIAIFVDGCFWHGCELHKNIPKTNESFWSKKISGNIERDKEVTSILIDEGWTVLRFWEHELMSSPENVIQTIREATSSYKA